MFGFFKKKKDPLIQDIKKEVNTNMGVFKPFNKDKIEQQEVSYEPEDIKPIPAQQPVPVQAKPREFYQVVRAIPTQEIRTYKDKDGNIVHLITVEEYELSKMTQEANKLYASD